MSIEMQMVLTFGIFFTVIAVIAVSRTKYLRKNYYKTYEGVLYLNQYKENKMGEKEALTTNVTYNVRNGLYFTVRELAGDFEMKIYTNLNGKLRCVETITEDLWGHSNSIIKIKGREKEEIYNYLKKERNKMFEEVKKEYSTVNPLT